MKNYLEGGWDKKKGCKVHVTRTSNVNKMEANQVTIWFMPNFRNRRDSFLDNEQKHKIMRST